MLLSISIYRPCHLFSLPFHALSDRKLEKQSMLFVLNTQGLVSPLERRGDGEFLFNLQPSLYAPTLIGVWLGSCCWFCPMSLHLSEVAPEACAVKSLT